MNPKILANLPSEIYRKFESSISPVTSISGISIVIPIRGFDRQNNLKYCISRLLQQNVEPLEIIVSEEDVNPIIKINEFERDSRVRKIFTKSKEGSSFNKCIAINAGVAATTYKQISINDADIILPRGYLFRVSNILQEYDACFLAKEIYNVDLLRSGVVWRGGKRVDYFSGGNISLTKEAFIRIGGMCEQFQGYGSEDCEFWGRVNKLCKLYENRECPLLHVNHKRIHNYSQNVEVYNKIMNTDIEKRLINLREDLNKYSGLI